MPHTYPHSTSVALDTAVKRLRAEQASVLSTFGAVGDGTTDDTAAFQNALNDIDASGGGMLYVPGGYTYSVGDITIPTGDNPIYVMGEGIGSLIVKRGTSTPTGTGWWDGSNTSNKVFRGLLFDAAYTAAPLGVDFGSISGDPLEALWSDNSSFWLHDSCDNFVFDHVKFMHSAGYSLIAQANNTDLSNLQLLYLELLNCRPRLLGYSSGPQIYGGWNGGVLLVGNGTSTTAMVRGCRVDHFRANRVTGNAFWTHLYGYSSLHENLDLVNPYGRDIGRDFIQIGGCSGVSVSDIDGRRIGYTTIDDTSASVPRYAANQWAVGIDCSGENYSVSITGGELTSCNGGYIDGDGLGNATLSGITLRTPRSTDEEYTADGIGTVGWGGSVIAGRDFAYGFQPGNTANTQFGGEDIEISGCSFINLSGGAIKGYAMRNGHIHNNNIQMPAAPGIQPIILGNVGTGPFQRAYGNVVHGNRTTYPAGSPAPVVFEDSSLGAFSPGDKNWVFDNPIVSSTDDAYEFYRDAGTSSTTRTVHSSEFPALTVRSEHWVQREGEPSTYTSVLAWYLQEGTSSWQHMRLQGFWKSASRGPLLNVSEVGVGGVIATGSRTTSVFSDAVVSGKLYGDGFLALTDTTYADADADLLPGTTWLLRYKHATGFPEQSLTVSGGHRVWTPFGSGTVGGSDQSVQYNKAGTQFGDSTLLYDYTNNVLIVSNAATAVTTTGLTGPIVHLAAETGNPRLLLEGWSGQGQLLFRRARGTNASPAALLSGDVLGALSFTGYTGSGYSGAVDNIRGVAAENWSGSANGSYLQFFTTALGTTTSLERMRIDSSGHVFVNQTLDDSTGAVLQLTGFVSATTGYYTASTSAAAIQAPAGGVTALNIVVSRPSIPQAYNFQIDGSGNLILQNSTTGPTTYLAVTNAGLLSIGSTVQIDQTGNISATGAIQATGASGAMSVPTNTARNSIQAASGGVAGLFLHIFGQATAPGTLSGAGTADFYFNSTSNQVFLSVNGGAWNALGAGTIAGSGTSAQVSFFNGTSSITGSSNLTWNNSTNILGVGGTNTVIDSSGNISFVGQAAGNATSGTNFNALSTASNAIQAASGGMNSSSGYSVGSTQFINSSRNLINIGSISASGSISTSSGNISTSSGTISASGSITASSGAFISGVTLTTLGININSNFQVNGQGDVSFAKQLAANGTGTVINAPSTTANNSIQTNGGFNCVNGYYVSGNQVINSSGVLSNVFGIDVSAGCAASGYNIHGGALFGQSTTVTIASTSSFVVSGGIITSVTAISDERMKFITTIPVPGLAAVLALTPIVYNWSTLANLTYKGLDSIPMYGFTAQNVQAAIPQAAFIMADGWLNYDRNAVTGALVNAIKELHAQIQDLTTKLASITH